LYLVDLPGYGYARGGAAAAAEFDRLVGEYFALPRADPTAPRGTPLGPSAVVLLVDARHPGLPADVAALTWLTAQDRPVVVIASKIDKLARAERQRAGREWTQALNVPVLPVSSATGEGLDQLWTQISRLLCPPPPPTPAPRRPPPP
jgi:GTP-binding protein